MNPISFYSRFLLLTDVADAGAGGGGEGHDGGTGGGEGPAPIELKDDSFVKLPGQEKPVQFKEWHRGLQGQLTKTSQQLSQTTERYQQLEAKVNDMGGKYTQALEQIKALTNAGKVDKGDALEAIKSLPYLTGAQAAELVAQLKSEQGGFSEQLSKRDQAILMIANIVQQMQGTVNQFGSSQSQQSFESKIKGFVRDGGYGDDMVDFAKELYLAYEGDDLDQEFPQILANRVKGLQAAFSKQAKAKADAARLKPWVPGKGGDSSPSKPLRNKFAKSSPKESADSLWESMQLDET